LIEVREYPSAIRKKCTSIPFYKCPAIQILILDILDMRINKKKKSLKSVYSECSVSET